MITVQNFMLITLIFLSNLGQASALKVVYIQGFRVSKFLNGCLVVWTSNLCLLFTVYCLLSFMKTKGEISVLKTDNLRKFCTVAIFIGLRCLATFTADVGLLTTIDYYDWLLFHGRNRDHTEIQLFNLFQSHNFQLQITIRSCQQQINVVDCRIYALANAV